MKTATIHIQDKGVPRGYAVTVGKGLLSQLETLLPLTDYSSVCIITDEYTQSFLATVTAHLSIKHTVIVVPAGDKNKTIETTQYIWQEMLNNHCDRKTLVINLGGGVVGDMGGFAASTYMRGIDFVQIPTSLLSQVDASVGGKVGINFHGIKNSIGSFQQPVGVIIDVDTLESLPKRQLVAGFGEIIKHGLIKDADYFTRVTAKKPEEFSQEEMIAIISRSVEIKRDIIQSDLTENNERKLINFGHTVGHAIEAIAQSTETPLMHGEAVSIGMLAEARLSKELGMLSEQDVETIKHALTHAGLPISYHVTDKTVLKAKMLSDKKNVGGKILWTLLERIGKGVYNKEIPSEVVEGVLTEL